MKLLLLALLASCATSRLPVNTAATPPQAPQELAAAELRDEDFAANEELSDTHVLVESSASKAQIGAATGGDPEEVEEVEDVPSERPFLRKIRTKRVDYWVDYFVNKQRERFQRFLNNAALYRPIIEKILDDEGLPRELFYVGLIESGYYLGAHSKASAVGPWQFITGTGTRYGLVINRDMDERRDIFKATRAAAQYFKDLHNIFSSWELALAAYNSGEYGVIRRITKYKTRDYYELSRKGQLPDETINYVPKVLAAMYVTQNAQRYGFHIPSERARFWQATKTVNAPKGTPLPTLAARLGVSTTLLVKLNPELRGTRTPARYPGQYVLRVPAGKESSWMEGLAASAQTPAAEPATAAPKRSPVAKRTLAAQPPRTASARRAPAKAAAPLVYKLKKGETLTDVARWFGTSVDALKRQNGITKGRALHVGRAIKIPRTKQGTYTVQRGDYLIKLADRFGLNPTALMKLNNLKRSQLYPGQRLVVNLR